MYVEVGLTLRRERSFDQNQDEEDEEWRPGERTHR